MGEVFKRGRVYWIDFYAGGERIRESAKTRVKREAEEFLTVREAAVLQGAFVRERKVTLEELGERYMEHSTLHKRSWKRDEQLLGDLERLMGNPMLKEITPEKIEKFQRERKLEVSNATTNRATALLKRMLFMAQKWKMLLTENPSRFVKHLPEDTFNPVTLTDEEEDRLVAAAPEDIQDLLRFDLNTGLRKSDLFGLKWENVDMERRELRLIVKKNRKVHEVPLNEVAFGVLAKQKRISEYVFINPRTGQPYKEPRVALAGATEKAGLSSFNWHMCRHTISTRLLEVADMVTVQEFVGHQSLNTTRRYTHPGKPGKRNAGDDLLKRRVARADQSGAKEEVGFGHILVTVPQRDAVGENVV